LEKVCLTCELLGQTVWMLTIKYNKPLLNLGFIHTKNIWYCTLLYVHEQIGSQPRFYNTWTSFSSTNVLKTLIAILTKLISWLFIHAFAVVQKILQHLPFFSLNISVLQRRTENLAGGIPTFPCCDFNALALMCTLKYPDLHNLIG